MILSYERQTRSQSYRHNLVIYQKLCVVFLDELKKVMQTAKQYFIHFLQISFCPTQLVPVEITSIILLKSTISASA